MAIREYKDEKGQRLWKVSINIRSKDNPAIRIQRAKFKCTSEKEAQREEVKMMRECQKEIFTKEARGSLWKRVVDAWELFLETEGDVHLAKTTRIDYVRAIRTYTSDWMYRPAASITRINVR